MEMKSEVRGKIKDIMTQLNSEDMAMKIGIAAALATFGETNIKIEYINNVLNWEFLNGEDE